MESLAASVLSALGGDVAVALGLCAVAAPLGNLRRDFLKEFLGSIVMIVLTVSPGSWIGKEVWWQGWLWQATGVVIADWVAGGPHVNASMSVAEFALGKLAYPELVCRVAAQLAAGLVTFPMCRVAALEFGLPQLSGPSLNPAKTTLSAAARDEALATIVLCVGVFFLNLQLPVRKNYWVKQTLTAGVVRLSLWAFPAAGPAMNPTLATGFAAASALAEAPFAVTLPTVADHYVVYWGASFGGALAAAAFYALWAGEPLFGVRTRLRPANGEKKEKSA